MPDALPDATLSLGNMSYERRLPGPGPTPMPTLPSMNPGEMLN